MKLLFACESFWPHIGGVQKVILEIARHCIAKGHEVHVATSKDPGRTSSHHEGIHIHSFDVSGNSVNGIKGNPQAYISFLRHERFDAILVKAAQQWSFDALIDNIQSIPSPIYHIPCGYSNLHHPRYRDYYQKLPTTLHQLAGLIYYSDSYQDVAYARSHGIKKYSLIPNGVAEQEFISLGAKPQTNCRHAITIGSPPAQKGHMECLQAFLQAKSWRNDRLILNGDYISYPDNPTSIQKLKRLIYALLVNKSLPPVRDEHIIQLAEHCRKQGYATDIQYYPRTELINALHLSDIFLFASHVEYSPLVLFESAAAGTPFLSLNVGNAREIAQWTGGGLVGPPPNQHRKAVAWLRNQLEEFTRDPAPFQIMGEEARKKTLAFYNWNRITNWYLDVLAGKQVDFREFL